MMFLISLAWLWFTCALQVPFEGSDWDLDARPNVNATDNLMFDALSSLLQHWGNTRFRNGHTMVPGTVPAGTLLYHGRADSQMPNEPQWVSMDVEHSYVFCRKAPKSDGCWMLTLVTSRALNVLYFDGTSAGTMQTGTMDAQDIVAWGKIIPERWEAEKMRIVALCHWGRQFGLDGFVRMEMDFEIMLCDFTAGVKMSSFLNILSTETILLPPREESEVMLAGSRHNRFPGDPRIKLDVARTVSFYDTSLVPSLVDHRFGVEHYFHRIMNISENDVLAVMKRLETVLILTTREHTSGVDWRALIHVIMERFADRLEMVQYLLEHSGTDAEKVQTQLRFTLQGHILHDLPIGSHDLSWAKPVFELCSTSHVRYAEELVQQFTESEKVVLGAVKGTSRELCRVVTRMWAQGVLAGFDVFLDAPLAIRSLPLERELLASWRGDISRLMAWLDWSLWVKCRPECDIESFCYLPSWPIFLWPDVPDEHWARPTPRCVSKTEMFQPSHHSSQR